MNTKELFSHTKVRVAFFMPFCQEKNKKNGVAKIAPHNKENVIFFEKQKDITRFFTSFVKKRS